jgi:uncharacterized membrane protein YdjX (TVP38/TMEM64 family)
MTENRNSGRDPARLVSMSGTEPGLAPKATPRSLLRRAWPLLVVFLIAVIIFAMGWHRALTLETLVRHRAYLEQLVAAYPLAAIGLYVAIYIVVAGLALPGAAALTIAGGALFGTVIATGATVLGATIGATAVFLIAKTAAGDLLARRAGPLAAKLTQGFCANGFSYMLFLRLVPFPFWIVNLAAALVGVPLRTFVVGTALGIIPGTFAFAFFGGSLDSVIGAQQAAYQECLASGRSDCRLEFDISLVFTPHFIAALMILALAAIVPIIIQRVRSKSMPASRADA